MREASTSWRTRFAVGGPLHLAVLRVVVPLLVLGAPEARDAVHYASLPPALRVPPLGFGWAVRLLPPTAGCLRVASALLFASAVLAAAGLFARASLLLTALAAFYVLGVAQLHGTVTHNHHLVWLLALLAASPCADVLSADAAWRSFRDKRPDAWISSLGAEGTLAHAVPLLIAWVLVAEIYFFPGLWKLRESGLAWITSDNLRNQMYWKWYQTGVVPLVRVDRSPLLCRAAALAAVVFELGFAPLVFFRRTRPFAVGAALGFHAFAAVFLRISYPSLWLCYVMFVDWRAVLGLPSAPAEEGSAAGKRPAARASLAGALVVGALLVGANAWFGAKGILRGWPFACYPTFQWIAGPTIPRLRVEVDLPDGRTVQVPLPREASPSRAQKQWGMEWSLAGVTDPPDTRKLQAHFEEIARRPEVAPLAAQAVRVRYQRAYYSVIPEEWGDPPRRLVSIAEWETVKPPR